MREKGKIPAMPFISPQACAMASSKLYHATALVAALDSLEKRTLLMWNRTLRFLETIYLLRIPALIWLSMLLMSLGSTSGAAGEPILRGVFDVASEAEKEVVFLRFLFVSLAAALAATSVGTCSYIILKNADERFWQSKIPAHRIGAGLNLLVRLLPLIAMALLLGRALHLVKEHPLAAWLGATAGLIAWYLSTWWLQSWLWSSPSFLEPIREARRIPGDKAGFLDKTGKLQRHNIFAAFQFLISVAAFLFYLAVTLCKQDWQMPALALILLLLMMICWSFSSLTFLLDRYRVPLVLAVIAISWILGSFRQNDHFYEALFRAQDPPKVPGSTVLNTRLIDAQPNEPVILVAATGGGIQASAWTARVLTGLSLEINESNGPSFHRDIRLVSSVSGGSVGAMYFLAAYENGAIPLLNNKLDENRIVTAAEASSLDDVTWGLAYPDLFLGLLPFIKGIGPGSDQRWHLVDGGLIYTDRGLTLEESWKRRMGQVGHDDATLTQWREEVKLGKRPAVIFNSTLVETGERYILSSTDFEDDRPIDCNDRSNNQINQHTGRFEFFKHYCRSDLKVRTAARLSATFPYVSPAARILMSDGWGNKEAAKAGIYIPQPHAVDGGYYDNYGMASLLDWLNRSLQNMKNRPRKVLIIEIRSYPEEETSATSDSRGFLFQTLNPLETILKVRGTGQLSHNLLDSELVRRTYESQKVEVCSIPFEFKNVDSRGSPRPEPLNWHLTPEDKEALRNVWNSSEIRENVRKVREFLNGGSCQL
jgi:hypothetical protein